MERRADNTTRDARTTLWSLRPAGEHAALRQAVQAARAERAAGVEPPPLPARLTLRALSLQRLVARDAGDALRAALAAPIRVYTSPAAVRFAALSAVNGAIDGALARPGIDIAVGSGTAKALQRCGVDAPRRPERMDSEGVLALPELQRIDGRDVGLITAPGGRGLLVPALRERGAVLRIAEVYARATLGGNARRLAGFIADEDGVLLTSSAEALGLLVARLSAVGSAKGDRVRGRAVVVSSERLAAIAADAGFLHVIRADGPTPAALIAAWIGARIAAAARATPLQ